VKVRFLLFSLLLAGLAALPAMALDLTSPQDNLVAMRKIQCSTVDGKVETYGWHGYVFSRVPGERDQRLFRVEGMNIRACGPLPDTDPSEGFKQVTREILLYQDPKTGEVVDTWENPWTGKSVKVIHVTNDPVNQDYRAEGRGGQKFVLPFSTMGNQWWLTTTVPLFYNNPLAGEYQEFIGGTYHATEMFNFFGDLNQLNDENIDSVMARVGWVRISRWLPWMEMGDRGGILYFHTAGGKLNSYDDLSETMRNWIAKNTPEYASPPPLDDERRNETSWTFFKKVLDAR
jgi:hypothetical protein